MRFFLLTSGLRAKLMLAWKLCIAAMLLLGLAFCLCVLPSRWGWTQAADKDTPAADPYREPGSQMILSLDGGSSITFRPGQRRLIVATGNTVRDAARNKVLYKIPSYKGSAGCVFSPDGKVIAAVSSFRQEKPTDPLCELRLCDASTGESLALLERSSRGIGITFSPDGKFLITRGKHGITLWDPHTGKKVRQLPSRESWVRCLAYHPDGKLLVSAESNILHFWDVEKGKLLRSLTIGEQGEISCLAISPDGKLLAGGHSLGGDATGKTTYTIPSPLRLWELPSGKEVAVLDGYPNGMIHQVAFRRDGRWLACAGSDNTVKIWDIPKRKLQYTLTLDGQVYDVAFSPDDRWLATAEIQRVKLWDLVPTPE